MNSWRSGQVARGIYPGLARSSASQTSLGKTRLSAWRCAQSSVPSRAPHPPLENQKSAKGNVAGRKPGSRNRLSEEIISSFLRDWRKHGDKALEKVRRTQPAAYCKLAVLLVPKEHKVEHTNTYENL